MSGNAGSDGKVIFQPRALYEAGLEWRLFPELGVGRRLPSEQAENMCTFYEHIGNCLDNLTEPHRAAILTDETDDNNECYEHGLGKDLSESLLRDGTIFRILFDVGILRVSVGGMGPSQERIRGVLESLQKRVNLAFSDYDWYVQAPYRSLFFLSPRSE